MNNSKADVSLKFPPQQGWWFMNALTLALSAELTNARLGEVEGVTIQWLLWVSLLASNGFLFPNHRRRIFCHYCRNFLRPMNCLFPELHELLWFLQNVIFQFRGNYYRKSMLKYCFVSIPGYIKHYYVKS